jgi:hypothetical protein
VIVDVEATPARIAHEIIATKAMLGRVEQKHGIKPERLAADKPYGTGPFLGWLSERKIVPHIPVLDRQHQTDGLLPREAFTFDPANNHYICPQGKILKHGTAVAKTRTHIYRATASDCEECPIRPECTRGSKRTLSVPFDETARQDAMALRSTEAFRHSRRLRRKVEMLIDRGAKSLGISAAHSLSRAPPKSSSGWNDESPCQGRGVASPNTARQPVR